jgi:hypothetical protein
VTTLRRTYALATAAATLTAMAVADPSDASTPTTDRSVHARVSEPAAERTVATPKRFERWATLTRTSYGYYYDAGQQDTHLTITLTRKGHLRFADTHTDVLRARAKSCHRRPARAGLSVVCRVPDSVNRRHPMTLRVFTRLGDDQVDTRALPRRFKLFMLCDEGREVIHAGAGNDFINGAQNADRIWGGPGRDWIRTGQANDRIWGGPGNDRLVGVNGSDRVHGGPGNDGVWGGPGNDVLYANSGRDRVLCGTGRDRALTERGDATSRDCESVRQK